MTDAGSLNLSAAFPAPEDRRRPLSAAERQQLAQHAVERLGDVLVARGVLTRAQLKRALAAQAKEAGLGHWVMLGELLEEWGLASPDQVEAALRLESKHNEPKHYSAVDHPSVRSRLKRLVDIVGALVGLGLTLSVLPFVALAITLEDGGPVFFQQHRVGRHGFQFPMWKFRTMVPHADRLKPSVESADPHFFKPAAHDPRITKVGQVLRKTMIDELPQFWNVLRGEMSLVGTRPPTLDEVTHYEPWHFRRLEVKPGITGLWQVSGQRHQRSFEDVLALDLDYQRRWGHLLDLQILIKTLTRVVSRHSQL